MEAAAAVLPVSADRATPAAAGGSLGAAEATRRCSLHTDHAGAGPGSAGSAVSVRYNGNGGVGGEVADGGVGALHDNHAVVVSGYGSGGGDGGSNLRGIMPLLQLAALPPQTGAPSLPPDANPPRGVQRVGASDGEQAIPGDPSHPSSSVAVCLAASSPEETWVTTAGVESGLDKGRPSNALGADKPISRRVLGSPTKPADRGSRVTGRRLNAGNVSLGRLSCSDHTPAHVPPGVEPSPNIAVNRVWEADRASPTSLVLSLMCASAPVPTPRQKQTLPRNDWKNGLASQNELASQVADAKLVLSLLPADGAATAKTSADTQEVLDSALGVLSLAGTLSWIEVYTSTVLGHTASAPLSGSSRACFHEGKPVDRSAASEDPRKRVMEEGSAGAGRASSFWPTELDVVDFTVLARRVRCLFDERCSLLQSHLNGGGGGHRREGQAYKEVASSSHQEWVHTACKQALECTWYTRLLLRRIVAAGKFDGEFRVSYYLPTETITDMTELCGSALEMLRGLCFPSTVGTAGGGDGCEDSGHELRTAPPEESRFTLEVGEMLLLLTAPAAIDLTASLMELVSRPMAWGDNLARPARTLNSDGIGMVLPVLVGLLERLVQGLTLGSTSATSGCDSQQQLLADDATCGEGDSATLAGSGARSLARKLAVGGTAALDGLLIVALDTLDAYVNRSRTLMEASQDRAIPRRVDEGDSGECRQPEEMAFSTDTSLSLQAAAAAREGTTARRHDRALSMTMDSRLPSPVVPRGSEEHFEVLKGECGGDCVDSGIHSAVEQTNESSAAVAAETEAVYSVIRGVSPVFRVAGPLLALLNAQFVPHLPSNHNERTDLSGSTAWTLSGCESPLVISEAGFSASLVSALRASIAFFSAVGETCWNDDADHDDVLRPEHFVDPLWSGFTLRYTGGRGRGGGGGVQLPKHNMQRQQVESRHHVKAGQGSCHSWPRGDQHTLLCRLHLEALAKLASTQDPVVHARLHELRVPRFLVQEVLGASGSSESGTLHSVEASIDQTREGNHSRRIPDDGLPVENNNDTVFDGGPHSGHPMENTIQSAGETATGLQLQGTVGHSAHQEGRGHIQEASDLHCANGATFNEPRERRAPVHDTPAAYVPPPIATGTADPVLGRGRLGAGSRPRDKPERLVHKTASVEPLNAEAGVGVVQFEVGDTVDGLVSVKSGRPRWFTG